MSYSGKSTLFKSLDNRQRVHKLGQKRDAEMWVTSTRVGGTRNTGSERTLYEVWIDGVELPEGHPGTVTVRLATDTVKSRALAYASLIMSFDRPIILDMVRNCLSELSLHNRGLSKSGRMIWKVSGGTPLSEGLF